MKIKIVKDISSETRAWADFYISNKKEKSEKESRALQALIDSLKETVKYIGETKQDPAKKSHDRDEALSSMWSETATAVRPYKPSLAQKCFFKGLFWADQSRFRSEDIDQLGISISDMEKEVLDAIKSI